MRTVGVEEELLLVSYLDGRPLAIGDEVAATADPIEHEFKQEQAEIASDPVTGLGELRAALVERRAELARAAQRRGALAVAIATSPVPTRPHLTEDERYERMNREFGLVARQQLTCGQHVHVGVESRAEGIAAIDRIQVWLPVVAAISSNSPYYQGVDTGYASYRTVLWGQWPTAGPTGPFGSVHNYEREVRELIGTGAALDVGMIYFDARLSAHYPTVEIRVADVCSLVDDSVLVAALCRALVDTAVADAHEDRPVPEGSITALRAARWRAARWGLDGELVDPPTGALAPADAVVDRLLEHAGPALVRCGDQQWVAEQLDRLRSDGTAARFQREQAPAGLAAVITESARRTGLG